MSQFVGHKIWPNLAQTPAEARPNRLAFLAVHSLDMLCPCLPARPNTQHVTCKLNMPTTMAAHQDVFTPSAAMSSPLFSDCCFCSSPSPVQSSPMWATMPHRFRHASKSPTPASFNHARPLQALFPCVHTPFMHPQQPHCQQACPLHQLHAPNLHKLTFTPSLATKLPRVIGLFVWPYNMLKVGYKKPTKEPKKAGFSGSKKRKKRGLAFREKKR